MLDAFFFFIAGISPKVKVLDEKPRRCPACGLHQAYCKRVDHYLSLFFIPIFKVKTGEPVIMCARCERTVPEFRPEPAAAVRGEVKACPLLQQRPAIRLHVLPALRQKALAGR